VFDLLDKVSGPLIGVNVQEDYMRVFSVSVSFVLLTIAHVRSQPMPKISDPNVTRLINNNEIHPIVRPTGQELQKRPWMQKKEPVINKAVLFCLSPYAKTVYRHKSPPLSLYTQHRLAGPDTITGVVSHIRIG
jgi:hypothetical protein